MKNPGLVEYNGDGFSVVKARKSKASCLREDGRKEKTLKKLRERSALAQLKGLRPEERGSEGRASRGRKGGHCIGGISHGIRKGSEARDETVSQDGLKEAKQRHQAKGDTRP